MKEAHRIARSQGRDVVGWEEIWDHFGTELDKSTIIHQWLPGSKIAANATSHGYRVLWSTDGVWYLDGLGTTWQVNQSIPSPNSPSGSSVLCLHASVSARVRLSVSVRACVHVQVSSSFRRFFSHPFLYVYVHLFFRSSFHQTMYTQEPCNGIPDTQCNTLMLGGGGCMWGETVDTSDIMQTIWPRMGAIAERLWSPRELTSADAATERYKAFRCLLNRRGIAAAPALNSGARKSPPGPGSCYAQ